MDKITNAISEYLKDNIPNFRSGDTINIGVKVIEGDKSRIQYFEGVVIAISAGGGMDKTFTIRKILSTPTPLEIFLIVKVLSIPPPADIAITTPSKYCILDLSPSITFTPILIVSPDLKFGILSFKYSEIAFVILSISTPPLSLSIKIFFI
jgi:ribosomal protein L19